MKSFFYVLPYSHSAISDTNHTTISSELFSSLLALNNNNYFYFPTSIELKFVTKS